MSRHKSWYHSGCLRFSCSLCRWWYSLQSFHGRAFWLAFLNSGNFFRSSGKRNKRLVTGVWLSYLREWWRGESSWTRSRSGWTSSRILRWTRWSCPFSVCSSKILLRPAQERQCVNSLCLETRESRFDVEVQHGRKETHLHTVDENLEDSKHACDDEVNGYVVVRWAGLQISSAWKSASASVLVS